VSQVPFIVFATDVVALQETVRAYATDLGDAIAACTNVHAAGYDQMQASWSTLRDDVANWIAEPPGYFWNEGTQYAAGQVLYARLQAMGATLSTMQCAAPPAPPNPNTDTSPTPPTPDWLRALQWGTAAVVVVAGAYGVSQLVLLVRASEGVAGLIRGRPEGA
jgi:hypothetical protein